MKIGTEDRLRLEQEIKDSRIYKSIMESISDIRKVKERENIVYYIFGIMAQSKSAGSGGVGSIRIRCMGEVLLQIGYGTGRNNYASLVHIGRVVKIESGWLQFNSQQK